MDPAKMKVVDLRSELGALGLDTKGNKPALVDRLKKALEAKLGKELPDTSVLDTSTEDVPETPKRERPAARTTRRSSSSRLAGGTPVKVPRTIESEGLKPLPEEKSPKPDISPPATPPPATPPPSEPELEVIPDPLPVAAPQPVPVPVPKPVAASETESVTKERQGGQELYSIDDEDRSQSPVEPQLNEEKMEQKQSEETLKEAVRMDTGDDKNNVEERPKRKRELTEEEEWEELNERLKIKEQERIEREKKQAEEDAQKLEQFKDDPVRLQRLKRKREKKARWSNYYRTIEATQEILTPPTEDEILKKNEKGVVEAKLQEPEIDESKVTLSWYDSDLNQYLDIENLTGVVPLSEGAFSHAWAGARATHGVNEQKVCFEVRVGSVVTTTENAEKDLMPSGLRIGWSTDDCTLHLGDGELSWGYESSGRAVNDSVFKEYGKKLEEKDVVGAYLDLESNPCTISYTHNGEELGVAYEFDKSLLDGKALFPHVLTKNMCYNVNFGNLRYNMLTKTKIVRRRIEIPVEQVLKEKKEKEAELQRIKEEAARREKEKKEKEKIEREERQKKKKEEKEKLEREKKEKEAAERLERGEPEPEEMEENEDKQKEEDPKENGEKLEESQEQETAKPEAEPMETDTQNNSKQPAETGEPQEMSEDQVYQGHTLDKRIKFVYRYVVEEELDGEEASLADGFLLICKAQLVPGPRQPETIADCEVILMVGMPGSGKTHWARQHCSENPHKRYNIISTGALFDKMKVDCKPFRESYDGRWDAMVSKCAKCVLKLLEIAKGRRRNYILDQTNVYPSAQRRKMREFDGYRRVAVVIVTDAETYKTRQAQRHAADGKEVPDPAVLDMKANFTLPEPCSWVDEVRFPELGGEQARAVLEAFHAEARLAGVVRERDKRERSEGRDAPPARRDRPAARRRDDRREPRWPPRDKSMEDRWSGGGGGGAGGGGGGGGGGGRWGPPTRGGGGGGAGGRWGRPPPPMRTNDRWGPPPRGGEFGREREGGGFRGGRGGRGERGGPRGPPPGDRFSRGGGGGGGGGDRGPHRGPNPPIPNNDKRALGPPPQTSNQGSWRGGGRGGASNRPNNAPNKGGQQDGQNAAAWNQWAGGWGGWGNWPAHQQNWGNWGNWGNWNQQGQQTGNQAAGNTTGNKNQSGQPAVPSQPGQQNQQNQQNQWGNYSAQQWYQWQQWQQQQQGWQQYQQQAGGQNAVSNEAAQAAWAQYYQNYNANAAQANPAANAIQGSDKK